MKATEKHLQDISEIRSIMERSSSFLTLSGLSGVFAGFFALLGAAFAYWAIYIKYIPNREIGIINNIPPSNELIILLFADAFIVLAFALSIGFVFTWRNTKRKGLKIWDNNSKRLLINLFIPLITGGLFGLLLIWNNHIEILASATLIFYGLALLNASKYTIHNIRFLGISEIILGLITGVFVEYSLLFWAIGFGVLHIIYGALIYFKYENK